MNIEYYRRVAERYNKPDVQSDLRSKMLQLVQELEIIKKTYHTEEEQNAQ